MEAMFDVCTMLGEGTCFTWSPHSATPTKQSRVSPLDMEAVFDVCAMLGEAFSLYKAPTIASRIYQDTLIRAFHIQLGNFSEAKSLQARVPISGGDNLFKCLFTVSLYRFESIRSLPNIAKHRFRAYWSVSATFIHDCQPSPAADTGL